MHQSAVEFTIYEGKKRTLINILAVACPCAQPVERLVDIRSKFHSVINWMKTTDFKKNGTKVLWLYGLSGAGKSTLALAVTKELNESMQSTVLLDGDNLRLGMCQDLGFSPGDRLENVRRTAELAKLLREQGFIVVVALMTPRENMRQMARVIIGNDFFKEVFVKCDYATCASRDTKGLYARAASGEILQFPGKDFMFEEPFKPDLVLNTATESIHLSVSKLINQFKDFLKMTAG